MNPRIQKLSAEIGKITVRITQMQIRLKELEQQRGELENTEIIETVRSVTVTPEELAAFIRAFRANASAILPEHIFSERVDVNKSSINNQTSLATATTIEEKDEPENEKDEPENGEDEPTYEKDEPANE